MPQIDKRKGWSDHKAAKKIKGGYGEKKTKGYNYEINKPTKRKGYSDTANYYCEKGSGKYPSLKSHPKRKGWSDFGRYEDGGVVGGIEDQAKLNAILQLRDDMSVLGSNDLVEGLKQKFKDGGVVKSQIDHEIENGYHEEEGTERSIKSLSADELFELLDSRD